MTFTLPQRSSSSSSRAYYTSSFAAARTSNIAQRTFHSNSNIENQFIMEESTTTPAAATNNALSTDELRRRRLAALGILQPLNGVINVAAATSTTITVDPSVQEYYKANQEEIINMLQDSSSSDDDDDDDDDAKKPAAKRKTAISLLNDSDSDSDIDLMEHARILQQRKKARYETQQQQQQQQTSRNHVKERPAVTAADLGRRSIPPAMLASSKVAAAAAKKNSAKNSKTKSSSGRTLASAATAASSSEEEGERRSWKFQVASWNVWFGVQDGGKPHPAPRMRTLVRILKQHSTRNEPILFIGMQEVTDELAVFLIPALEAAGYRVFRQPNARYGCAVAVHQHLEIISHSWNPYSQTVMQRGFYQVRAKLPNKNNPNNCPEIVFTTTHLESWTGPNYTGAEQRVPQLQEMEEFCCEQTSIAAAIMTGDMNWDDERSARSKPNDPVMATVLKQQDWKDSFLTTRTKKSDGGFTYDAKLNPMLGGNLRRRFDRCLLLSSRHNNNNKQQWNAQPLDTKLVGTEAIPDLTWDKFNSYNQSYREMPTAPSDHFGLLVLVEVSKGGDMKR